MTRTGFTDDFKRSFLTGLAALFPILITIFLLFWLYRELDATLGAGITGVASTALAVDKSVFGTAFPGAGPEDRDSMGARRAYAGAHFPRLASVVAGLVVAIGLIYLTGKSLRGYIGRRSMKAVDRFFERFPVIKAVYPYARQVGDLLFGQSQKRLFSRVVAVQYPRRGVYAVAFLIGEGVPEIARHAGRELVTVFVPTSPTPVTGFVVVLPPEEVVHLEMSVDEAFRFLITAGMLGSGKLANAGRPLQEAAAAGPAGEAPTGTS